MIKLYVVRNYGLRFSSCVVEEIICKCYKCILVKVMVIRFTNMRRSLRKRKNRRGDREDL